MRDDDMLAPEGEDLDVPLPVSGKRVEKWLDGDLDDPDRYLESRDQEQQEHDEGAEVSEEEIREAEGLDLHAMQGRAIERDAFEDWVRMSDDVKRKYNRTSLTPEELERELIKAHSSDPDVAAAAEDTLVRWNVKWIIRCLHRWAGSQIMSRPSQLREDLLSEGRWGFVVAIRKYNHEEAAKNGFKKASILTYSDQWIRKFVNELLAREHYGLNEDAAYARKKIIDARNAIREKTHGEATPEAIVEYLERAARVRLEKAGVVNPDRKQLRQKGALTVERVRELLAHETQHVSTDTPTGDEGGPTIGERVGSEEDLAGSLEEREQFEGLVEQVRRVGRHRHRRAFEMLNGLPVGYGRMDVFSRAEAAAFLGRTTDSVATYVENVKREVRGEALLEPGQVQWVLDGEDVPESIRSDMARQVDLRRVLQGEGFAVDLASPVQTIACPDGGGTMTLTPSEYMCSCCARQGDLFSWLVERRGLTPGEAIVEAGRMSTRLTRLDLDGVVVTVDPGRRRALEALR